jgi:hypothetical protein
MGEERNVNRIFARIPEEKEQLGRSRCRWEYTEMEKHGVRVRN